jgi:hypothetical protein
MKKLVNKFIKTFSKKSFEDSVMDLINFVLKQKNISLSERKSLLPVIYASCICKTITMSVKKLRKRGFDVYSNKTVLERVKDIDISDIMEFNDIIREVIIKVARRYGFCNRRTVVSIDFHEKPFYGKKETKGSVGIKRKAGTNQGYRYASICICEEGLRFNLFTIPIAGRRLKKSVVQELIREARRYVRVGIVLLDRGFNGTEVFDIIDKKCREKYLMPLIRYPKVKKDCHTENKIKAMFYTFYECRSKEYQTKVRVIVDNRKGETHYFVTNISEERRAELSLVISVYRKRWGIETGYRVADEFFAWTTSKDFSIRSFLALLSFLMQDFWILYNFIEYSGTKYQQPRTRLLKKYRKFIFFIKRNAQKLGFYWRPAYEAELFREDLIDCVKARLA